MLHLGFSQSKSDCSSINAINSLKRQLSDRFKLKYLGDLGYFLGLEVVKSKSGIFVSQRNYTL